MKKSILYSLSFLLIAAILAPSAAILVSLDDSTKIVMDFSQDENKKENKEGKKEINEKDFLFYTWQAQKLGESQNKNSINEYYLELKSLNASEILLPPPEHTV